MDGTHAHVGHEVAGEETSEIAEEKRHDEQQAHEYQRLMLASTSDEVAHEPVEIAHQVVGGEGELGLGQYLHCTFLEEQVEEWSHQRKGEQREENGDQVEDQIQDDAAPVGFNIGEYARESLLLGHGRLVFGVGIHVEELLQFSEFVFKDGFVGQMQFVFGDKCWRHASA